MASRYKHLEYSKSEINHIRKKLVASGIEFKITYIGQTTTFEFMGSKTKQRFGGFKNVQGMHIPKIVMKNVFDRLDKGLYVPKNKDPERFSVNTIMYNPINISNNLMQYCVAIDINSCYFNTAFKLGIIDEHTYKAGFKKDREYKFGRNVAIGSIGADVIYEHFKDGKKIDAGAKKREGACSRLDVIDHVFEIATDLAMELKEDFLMMRTDCFFVPKHRLKFVQDKLKKFGYNTKYEEVMFGKIQRMSEGMKTDGQPYFTDEVHWYCPDCDEFKYHFFSSNHVFSY